MGPSDAGTEESFHLFDNGSQVCMERNGMDTRDGILREPSTWKLATSAEIESARVFEWGCEATTRGSADATSARKHHSISVACPWKDTFGLLALRAQGAGFPRLT